MRAAAWIIGASVLVVGTPHVSARAQEVRVITDEVSCDSCVIDRYLVATIHDRAFPGGALIRFGFPHVNTDGTFLVIAGPLAGSELFLANPDGSIVRRIGQTGEGPGEYQRVTHVLETPSAYLVFDVRLSRVTRLSKTTFEVLGTTSLLPIGGAVRPLVFEDGSFLYSGFISTRGGVGHPFHLLDPSGQAVRSFGGQEGAPTPRRPEYPQILALSRDGTFWAVDQDRYRIERWDREGTLLEVIQREADWYPDNPRPGLKSGVYGLWEDEDGLLWVFGRHTEDTSAGSGDEARKASIIEVIDPSKGAVVAASRTDGLIDDRAFGGFFQMVHKEDPQMLLTIEVWAAKLKKNTPSPKKERRDHEFPRYRGTRSDPVGPGYLRFHAASGNL